MGVAQDESFTRALSSSWWFGEAEQVFQRIERWATFARGYNRLRPTTTTRTNTSNKTSGTMAWCSMSNLSNRNSQGRSKQQQVSEKSRLGCCGTRLHTYRSNANFENGNPLEEYSLDHSMYFKTIGEIRACGGSNGNVSREDVSSGGSSGSRQLPLDCGDFLSTDFEEDDFVVDEEDDEDMKEVDEREHDLVEQLQMLKEAYETARFFGSDEDRINNNDADEMEGCAVDRRGSRCSSSASRASREGLASLLGLAH